MSHYLTLTMGGRYQGGYGRVKYAVEQLYFLGKYDEEKYAKNIKFCNENIGKLVSDTHIDSLEEKSVFFSRPLDLDMMMIQAYPGVYEIEENEIKEPANQVIKRVLGDSAEDTKLLPEDVCQLFDAYRTRFKSNSKPATHLNALACMNDGDLKDSLPHPLRNLVDAVKRKLKGLPE